MQITNIAGGQLEKDRSNSPEDSFSRCTVSYEAEGDEKHFSVLYPLIFEDKAKDEGLFTADEPVREMIAVCFFERYPKRKRVYVSDEAEFLEALKSMDKERIVSKLNEINRNAH
ncbi:hypothetical protein [Guptibacillus algicola]|uniref:hypothetical protein n=1 Tax=Guptibacillus algicola TaxID=225844 RepID=UPI001CD39464|nr:hypothetical protein [Alkalihalobacillus algicola]MCA0985841.1 hypothetical protein [Alkalihalobacillus algicola]